MSNNLKPASLRPCHDTEVADILAGLIRTIHTSLAGARIAILWMLGKPLTTWGRITVVTEQLWWLSGGLEDGGVDIALQVNEALWNAKGVTTAGRTFILDHHLAQVKAKSGGLTEMDTEQGARKLYEKEAFSLGMDPAVCARNPRGLKEIAEAKNLWLALSKPEQFKLFAEEEDERGEDDRRQAGRRNSQATAREARLAKAQEPRPEVVRPPKPEPVFYHAFKNFTDLGPSAVRYTEADLRPESVVGVHYFNAPGDAVGMDFALLDYDPRVKSVREALEAEHAEWVGSAQTAADVGEAAH